MVIGKPPLSPTSDFPAKETSAKQQEADNETRNDVCYRTKEIKFLGRTTNIILQNKNGPCPLIAICNVLLLRNDMNLHPVHDEISEERLLSLVANTLIELNSFGFLFPINDEEYIANQQKKISNAIDLLPCLANGINVNIKFRRIDEFESTPELATFELLRIPLLHGWILNPMESEIDTAIGSKSYNDLTTELVVLKTQFPKAQSGQSSGECSVNFSESIASALGVPSQRCSITSVADTPPASAEHTRFGKVDTEEEIALLQALTLSKREALGFDICSEGESLSESMSKDETLITSVEGAAGCTNTLGSYIRQQSKFAYLFSSWESEEETDRDVVDRICEGEEVRSTTSITNSGGALDHDLSSTELGDESVCDVETENSSKMTNVHVTSPEKSISIEETNVESTKNDSISKFPLKSEELRPTTSITKSSGALDHNQLSSTELGDESVCDVEIENSSKMTDVQVTSPEKPITIEETNVESTKNDSISEIPLKSEGETFHSPDLSGTSKDDDVNPYEVEECVSFGSPVYEGESLLGESSLEMKDTNDTNVLTPEEGEVIKRFLNDNATQLTWHGLFYLKQGLKEDELCVLFRNNHFYTMLKRNNELYTLVTDQGYLMEKDLVWERLDQVFKSNSGKSQKWDQQDAFSDIDHIFGMKKFNN